MVLAGAPRCAWTVQLGFHGATGLIESQLVGPTMPFVRNEWKEIKCVIDLDTDWLQIYYDGISSLSTHIRHSTGHRYRWNIKARRSRSL